MDTEQWLMLGSLLALLVLVATLVTLCVKVALNWRRTSRQDLEKQCLTKNPHVSYDSPSGLNLDDSTTYKHYKGDDDDPRPLEPQRSTATTTTDTSKEAEPETDSERETTRGMRRGTSIESSASSDTGADRQIFVIARIDFDIEYDREAGELVVSVIGARDLPGSMTSLMTEADGYKRKQLFSKRRASASSEMITVPVPFLTSSDRRKSEVTSAVLLGKQFGHPVAPDTYVVVSLDGADDLPLCTDLQISDFNPMYKERFTFYPKVDELAARKLILKVFAKEKKDRLLGISSIVLGEIEITRPIRMSLILNDNMKLHCKKDKGDIMFSLSYLPTAQRLTIVVVKVRVPPTAPPTTLPTVPLTQTQSSGSDNVYPGAGSVTNSGVNGSTATNASSGDNCSGQGSGQGSGRGSASSGQYEDTKEPQRKPSDDVTPTRDGDDRKRSLAVSGAGGGGGGPDRKVIGERRRSSIVDTISSWMTARRDTQPEAAISENHVTEHHTDTSEYHVKVSLYPVIVTGSHPLVRSRLAKRKTKPSRGPRPTYNEALTFNITGSVLNSIVLRIRVIRTLEDRSQEVVGECEVGGASTVKSGVNHWSEMLASPRSPIAMWHSLQSP